MIRINLIPKDYLDEEKKREFLNLSTIVGGVVLLLFFAIGGACILKTRILAKNVQQLESELARYEDINAQIETLETRRSQIQSKITVIEKLLAERFELAKFLEDLVFSLPHEAWLSSLTSQASGGVFQIQIQASSLGIAGIIDWISELEKKPTVSNLNLGTITNTPSPTESLSNFQISFQYKP